MQQPHNAATDQLKSSDPAVREGAIRALGQTQDPAVLGLLKQVQANDPDPKLRQLAAQMVQQIPIQLTQPPGAGDSYTPLYQNLGGQSQPSEGQPNQSQASRGQHGDRTFQMLWDCRFCGTKKLLAVDHRHCPNCGAAQDPAWRYYPSEADKKTISDPNYVYAGVDKVCPSCGQPNSASAKFCKDCGTDLANAKQVDLKDRLVTGIGQDASGVVEDVAMKKAQQQAAMMAASKKRGLSRTQVILLGIVGLVVVIGAVIAFLALSKHLAAVTVTDKNWTRVINIDQYNALSKGDWQDSVPGDAYNRSCHAEQRQHQRTVTENCGVERVDNGDGSYSERDKTCSHTENYYTSDTYCNYTVNRWQSITPMKTSGGPSDSLVWPNFTPAMTGQIVGAQRESSRSQTLAVLFKENSTSGHSYTLNLTSANDDPANEARWHSFASGQQYDLQVNGLNMPDWKSLKPVGAQ